MTSLVRFFNMKYVEIYVARIIYFSSFFSFNTTVAAELCQLYEHCCWGLFLRQANYHPFRGEVTLFNVVPGGNNVQISSVLVHSVTLIAAVGELPIIYFHELYILTAFKLACRGVNNRNE
jgi:hypothetical protein